MSVVRIAVLSLIISLCCSSAYGQTCGNSVVESGEQCDPPGPCCTSKCVFASSRTVCRDSKSVCDPEEYCTGASVTCPADVALLKGMLCRPSSGPCDKPEYCDASGNCPGDSFIAGGTICRGGPLNFKFPCVETAVCSGTAAGCPLVLRNSSHLCRPTAGPCDVAEYCTGFSMRCPSDAFLPSTTSCGNGLKCSGAAAYCPTPTTTAAPTPAPTTTAPPPTPSSPVGCGNGVVDTALGEQCDPPGTCCTFACRFAPNTTVCRPNSGLCDKVEFCTGVSTQCPLDTVKPRGSVCRGVPPDVATCDIEEVCDGVTKLCPVDQIKRNGEICRPVLPYAPCDVAEVCNGRNTTCPPDVIATAGVQCRNTNTANYPCYTSAFCDGLMKFCPQQNNVPCP